MATKKTTTAKTTKTTGKGAKGAKSAKGSTKAKSAKLAKQGAAKDYDAAPGAAKEYDAAKPAHPLASFENLTLGYTNALRAQGTTPSTIASYTAELNSAAKYFGADANPLTISAAALEEYFWSPQVNNKRDGSPRSQLTIDKTRRALRMAFEWARDEMGCELACNDALKPAKPGKLVEAECSVCRATFHPTADNANACARCAKDAAEEAKLDAELEPAAERATRAPRATKGKHPRKGAITLEVSQPDAEAAADFAEGEIAKGQDESAQA